MASQAQPPKVSPSGPEHVTWSYFWSSVRGYPLTVFFICLIGAALANMDQALFAFVLTEMSQEFGWSVVERGWYITITFALAGAGVAGLGVLTDRIGRKRVFKTSILFGGLFVTLMRWAPNTFWMLTLRTLGFTAGGIQSPVTGTIVVEESPPRFRGLLSGVLQVGYPIGWFVASQLAVPIMAVYSWRHIFLIALFTIPYMFLVGRYLRETGAFTRAKAARDHAAATGTKLAATHHAARIRDLFARRYWFRTLVLFTGEFLHVFAYGSTFLLTAYFREARGWEPGPAITMVGYSYGVGAIGYVVAAFVGEFLISRRNTIILWSVMGSLAFSLMIWTQGSWWYTAVTFCLMTMFFYGTTAVKFTFIAENFPTRLRATGVTFAGSLAVNLGVATGPLALSYAVEHLGWNMAYTLCGILPIFMSGMVFLALPPIAQGIREDEEAEVALQAAEARGTTT
jgi:MFS family permease